MEPPTTQTTTTADATDGVGVQKLKKISARNVFKRTISEDDMCQIEAELGVQIPPPIGTLHRRLTEAGDGTVTVAQMLEAYDISAAEAQKIWTQNLPSNGGTWKSKWLHENMDTLLGGLEGFTTFVASQKVSQPFLFGTMLWPLLDAERKQILDRVASW